MGFVLFVSVFKENVSTHFIVFIVIFLFFFQEADGIKAATSWPDYYIDQLRCMSAVSDRFIISAQTIITRLKIHFLLNHSNPNSPY